MKNIVYLLLWVSLLMAGVMGFPADGGMRAEQD